MLTCDSCNQPIKNTDSDGEFQQLCDPCESLVERTEPLRIAQIKKEDLELILAWRSNPRIYDHFREQNSPLDWENHVSWYESREADRHDFMIHYDSRRVGVVSITETDEISIYLGDFSVHGNRIATAALNWICDRFKHRTPLIAEVHEQNTASIRLFEGCGFQQYARDGEWIEYRYS